MRPALRSKVDVHVVDAFTTTPGHGNRAGVVLDAGGLDRGAMQAVAAFAGYSETAFVLAPEDATHRLRVRYFTPTAEVPICGHATVAAHFLRASLGHAADYPLIARTGAGDLSVGLEQADGRIRVSMMQGTPHFEDPLEPAVCAALTEALRIAPDEIGSSPIQIVSTGHSKVLVPVRRRAVLDALQPDMPRLSAVSAQIGCNGFFPFVLEGSARKPLTYGRMFAPAIGIDEDPVTGNANGPLGAYLVHHGLVETLGKLTYPGHQGIAMGRPGVVHVTVDRRGTDGRMSVSIAGDAVVAGIRTYAKP
ncbi:PhzF family phenazine biosynthesis isomerase [Yoonia litorea]|uniref:Phenazine biosynthesis protein PhzF family n=1 Tax=Yoonia litorea TaxID=1123755 RepID=A0A1I6ML30_9RHOB|nr:PhzF family phenazine biosynthesis isomerase [Yoonia litorea]SFS16405.1 phenazine biosynthesis protein PhzF family [Yoonia litorea]